MDVFHGTQGGVWILTGMVALPWGLALMAVLTVIHRSGTAWDEITRRWPLTDRNERNR